MQEQISSNPPPQQASSQEKKSSKLPMILLFLFTALLFGGLGIVGGKMLLCEDGAELAEKKSCSYNDTTYNDGDSFDADDGCNKCLCSDGTVTCTEVVCETENGSDNDNTDNIRQDWLSYDGRVKLKYPKDWTLNADEDNPLYFNITVTSKNGSSLEVFGTDGDFGVFCIFDDTDTTNMPEVYTNGIILREDFPSYEDFEIGDKKLRYTPSGDDDTYKVCGFEDSSGFYRDYIENKFISFIIPDEEVATEELEILKEIQTSILELN